MKATRRCAGLHWKFVEQSTTAAAEDLPFFIWEMTRSAAARGPARSLLTLAAMRYFRRASQVSRMPRLVAAVQLACTGCQHVYEPTWPRPKPGGAPAVRVGGAGPGSLGAAPPPRGADRPARAGLVLLPTQTSDRVPAPPTYVRGCSGHTLITGNTPPGLRSQRGNSHEYFRQGQGQGRAVYR